MSRFTSLSRMQRCPANRRSQFTAPGYVPPWPGSSTTSLRSPACAAGAGPSATSADAETATTTATPRRSTVREARRRITCGASVPAAGLGASREARQQVGLSLAARLRKIARGLDPAAGGLRLRDQLRLELARAVLRDAHPVEGAAELSLRLAEALLRERALRPGAPGRLSAQSLPEFRDLLFGDAQALLGVADAIALRVARRSHGDELRLQLLRARLGGDAPLLRGAELSLRLAEALLHELLWRRRRGLGLLALLLGLPAILLGLAVALLDRGAELLRLRFLLAS